VVFGRHFGSNSDFSNRAITARKPYRGARDGFVTLTLD
jgi:hypothetical protein